MWEQGRQNSGYKKRKLFQFVSKYICIDSYLIHYPLGSKIPPHKDPVNGYKHYRLNFIYKRAARGGNLYVDGLPVKSRLSFLKPDRQEHRVTTIRKGMRKVFSLGLAIRTSAGKANEDSNSRQSTRN